MTAQSTPEACADWYPDTIKTQDPYEDSASPTGKDEMSCTIGESGGPGLHVTFALGNVWTRVPILTTYGDGDSALDLALTYNSMYSDEDEGLGYGWRLGFDTGREAVVPWTLEEFPEITRIVTITDSLACDCKCLHDSCEGNHEWGGLCAANPPITCDPNWSTAYCCPKRTILSEPGRVVITNSIGQRTVHYRYEGGYGPTGGNPAPEYTPNHWRYQTPLFPPQGGGHEILNELESGQDYVFRLDASDGTKFFFKATTSSSGGYRKAVLGKIVNPRGRALVLSHNGTAIDRPTSFSDGFNRTVYLQWNGPDGRLSKIVHPISGEETNLYYTNGELTSVVDPLSNASSFTYEVSGAMHRIVSETLKNGRKFTCSYADITDSLMVPSNPPSPWKGRTLSAVKSPTESTVMLTVAAPTFAEGHGELDFGPPDNVFRVRNGNNDVWEYTRSTLGRITQKKFSTQSGIQYQSDLGFEEHAVTNPSIFRHVTSITPHIGLKHNYTWTSDGRLLEDAVVVDAPVTGYPQTLTTSHTYAPNSPPPSFPRSLPIATTQPNGGEWEYEYDSHGEPTVVRDPIRETTTDRFTNYAYDYDSNGRFETITETNRREFQTIKSYNPDGSGELTQQQVQVADGQYITTTFDYDGMGRRTHETVQRDGESSITTKYDYDAMGRTTMITENYVSGGPENDTTNMKVLYSYDGHGLLTGVTNARGIRTEYEYDHRNWMTKKTEDAGTGSGCLNLVTLYEYDGNGNVNKMTDPAVRETTYHYDAADHMDWTVDAEGYKTTMKRDQAGRITELRRQRSLTDNVDTSDTTLVYTALYDGLGRVVSYRAGGTATTALFTRTYDYGGWSAGGGGCSCSGLGTGLARKIESTAVGETKVTYNEVDLLGRLTKVIRKANGSNPEQQPEDSVTVYKHDAEGNTNEIHGPEGELTILDYDGADRMTKRTVRTSAANPNPAQDLVTEYGYNGVGRITRVILPTAKELTYHYDPADRLSDVVDSAEESPLASFTYDANGNRKRHTDGAGNNWDMEYDRLDRLHIVRDPIKEEPTDGITTYNYDAVGNVVNMINNNEVHTCYRYDKLNRLLCTIEGCDTTTLGTGENRGQLDGEAQAGNQAIDPLGGGSSQASTGTENTWTCNMYDGRFLMGLEDHDYNQTTYEYDRAGRITDVYYPGTTPASGSDHLKYEYVGQDKIKRTDQRLIETTFEFDRLGKLMKRGYYNPNVVPPSRYDIFGFDKSGRLENTRYQRGHDPEYTEWTRDYDMTGRPSGESQYYDGVNPYTLGMTHALDRAAQTQTQTLHYPGIVVPNPGRQVNRVFDARGRLSDVTSPSTYASWQFDADSRRIASRQGADEFSYTLQSSFTYDDNGRLTGLEHVSEFGVAPEMVAGFDYGYDPVGNRTFTRNRKITDRSEHYGYDDRNRLTVMDRGTLNATGTGVTEMLSHSVLTRKQQWTDLDHRGNWLDYREQIRFPGPQPLPGSITKKRIAQANGGNEYTCLSTQLGPQSIPFCTSQPTHDTPSYDAAGNMNYNPLGRIVSDVAWCASGVPNCPTGHDYAYDEENRLVAIHRDTNNGPGPDTDEDGLLDEPKLLEFKYDSLGRRTLTIEYVDPQTGATYMDGSTPIPHYTRHVYHGLEVVQEYTCIGDVEGCTGTWTLAREFVWGDSNRFPEPIAMVDYTGANGAPNCGTGVPPVGCVYHYLRDVLGSVVGLTDSTGNLVERYTYDPYGKTYIEKWTGTAWTAVNASSVGNPFAWTGQRYDAATGTYHFHFRTYSPAMGRWLQRDPIEYDGGSINLYEYVMSSAINMVDPLGLAPGPKKVNLKEAFKETCDKECTAQCKKKSSTSKPTSQGAESCGDSKKPAKTEKECHDDCMVDCEAEADRIIAGIQEQIKRCTAQAKKEDGKAAVCNVWSSRLRWLFGRMNLKYFKFEAISMVQVKRHSAHVVVGIRGSSDTEQFEGHDVWDFIIDITRWNEKNNGGELYGFKGGTGEVQGPNKTHKGSFRPLGPTLPKARGEETDEGPWPDWFPPI